MSLGCRRGESFGAGNARDRMRQKWTNCAQDGFAFLISVDSCTLADGAHMSSILPAASRKVQLGSIQSQRGKKGTPAKEEEQQGCDGSAQSPARIQQISPSRQDRRLTSGFEDVPFAELLLNLDFKTGALAQLGAV